MSTEVDPRIVYDTDRTIAEARALWRLVDRPNLLIKIPAAKQGLPAITACLAEGISINVALIFSLARYAVVQVLEDQGVSTFEASWYHLCQRLAAVLRRG